jgi:hypothetical protein
MTPVNEASCFNVASKAYLQDKYDGTMTNIVEKKILSSKFVCGIYSFASALEFLQYVQESRKRSKGLVQGELAVSDVVWRMMLSGVRFHSIRCDDYQDWGTLPAWKSYCAQYKTLFLDIDGTLVKNSGQYFSPQWGTTPALVNNVDYLRKVYQTGKVRIVLTTSRKPEFEKETKEQLKKWSIPYDQIIFDLPHAQRILVNDFAPTNSYPSASSINLGRNAENLADMLQGMF